MQALRLQTSHGDTWHFVPKRLLVVGFSGRNQMQVRAHVDELAALGVPAPDHVPSFYPLDPGQLTLHAAVQVSGQFTSGEVEPVLFVDEDARYLGVGSDHTDRALEVEGIQLAKEACPKVVGTTVISVDRLNAWDDVRLRSWADDQMYQAGTLAQILPLSAIEAEAASHGLAFEPGDVVFLGTIPVIGDLRPAARFRASLDSPEAELVLDYEVIVA